MPEASLKVACFAFVLGCFATVGHAHAVPPLQFNGLAPLVIPVADEDTAIEQMERPNEDPAGSQEQATPADATPPPPSATDNSEGAEERELKRELPSTEWPADK
jgi:hypothetical protein